MSKHLKDPQNTFDPRGLINLVLVSSRFLGHFFSCLFFKCMGICVCYFGVDDHLGRVSG